ncbi:MAG: SRPBCC family protein [Pseudonocardia sp.]
MIDVTHQISAVRRSVGTRVLEAGEARVQTISQTYPSDVVDVWDACTNAERLPRWFAPVSGDLRLGGRYQVEGNAGGTIERCDPPKGFAATWEFGGEVSWIEVALVPEGEGTRFTLEHVAHVKDEFWTQYGPGATGVGWDLALLGLATHLATGADVPPEASTWAVSPAGLRFVAESSAAWCAAGVEAGADLTAAREAAARTTAFYTGAPET